MTDAAIARLEEKRQQRSGRGALEELELECDDLRNQLQFAEDKAQQLLAERDAAQENLLQAESDVQQAAEFGSQLLGQVQSLRAELDTCRSELDGANNELVDLREDKENLRQTNLALQHDKKVLNDTLEDMIEQSGADQNELEKLQSRQQAVASSQGKEEITKLVHEARDAQLQADSLAKQLAEVQADRDKLQVKLKENDASELRKKIEDLDSELAEAREVSAEEIQELERRNQELEESLEELDRKSKTLRSTLMTRFSEAQAQHQTQLSALQDVNDELQMELQDIRSDRGEPVSSRRKSQEQDTKLKTALEENESLASTNQRLEEKIQKLSIANTELDVQQEAAKASLEKLKVDIKEEIEKRKVAEEQVQLVGAEKATLSANLAARGDDLTVIRAALEEEKSKLKAIQTEFLQIKEASRAKNDEQESRLSASDEEIKTLQQSLVDSETAAEKANQAFSKRLESAEATKNELKAQVDETKKALAAMQSKLKTAEQAQGDTDRELEARENALKRSQSALAESEQLLQDANVRISSMESDLNRLQSDAASSAANLEELRTQIAAKSEINADVVNRVASLSADVDRIDCLHKDAEKRLEKARELHAAQICDRDNQLESVRATVASQSTEIAELTARVHEVDAIKKSADAAEADVRRISEECTKANQEIDRLQRSLQLERENTSTQLAALREMRTERDSALSTVEQVQVSLNKLQIEHSRVQAKMADLQAGKVHSEEEQEELQRQLEQELADMLAIHEEMEKNELVAKEVEKTLSHEIADREEDIAILKDALEESELERERLEGLLAEVNSTIEDKAKEDSDVQEKLAALQRENLILGADINNTREALKVKEAAYQNLEDVCNQSDGQIAQLNQRLSAAATAQSEAEQRAADAEKRRNTALAELQERESSAIDIKDKVSEEMLSKQDELRSERDRKHAEVLSAQRALSASKQECEALELEVSQTKVQLADALSNLENQQEVYDDELLKLHSDLEDTKTELATIVATWEEEAMDAEAKEDKLLTEKKRLEERLARKDEKIAALSSSVSQDRSAHIAELQKLTSERDEMSSLRDQIQLELAAANAKASRLEGFLQKSQDAYDKVKAEASARESKLVEKLNLIAEEAEVAKRLKKSLQKAQTKLQDLNQENEKLSNSVESLKETVSELEDEKESLVTEVNDLMSFNLDLHGDVQSSKDKLEDKDREIKLLSVDYEREIDELKFRIDELEEASATKSSKQDLEVVQSSLEKSQQTCEKLKRELMTLKEENTQLQEQNIELTKDNYDLGDIAQELRDDIRKLKDEQELQGGLSTGLHGVKSESLAEQRVEDLEAEVKSLKSEAIEVRNKLREKEIAMKEAAMKWKEEIETSKNEYDSASSAVMEELDTVLRFNTELRNEIQELKEGGALSHANETDLNSSILGGSAESALLRLNQEDMMEELNKTKQQLLEKDVQVKELELLSSKTTKENEQLKDQLNTLTEEQKSLMSFITEVNAELKNLKAQRAAGINNLAETTDMLSKIDSLDPSASTATDSSPQIPILQETVTSLTQENGALKKDLEKLSAELESAKQELVEVTSENDEMIELLRKTNVKNKSLEKENKELKSKMEDPVRMQSGSPSKREVILSNSKPGLVAWGLKIAPRSNGQNGAKIADVTIGGAAQEAGAIVNDLIVGVNGRNVDDEDAGDVLLAMKTAGNPLHLSLRAGFANTEFLDLSEENRKLVVEKKSLESRLAFSEKQLEKSKEYTAKLTMDLKKQLAKEHDEHMKTKKQLLQAKKGTRSSSFVGDASAKNVEANEFFKQMRMQSDSKGSVLMLGSKNSSRASTPG